MTENEETLRYWLSQEDIYPSRYTQNFLKNTPLDEIGDTLARIANDAEPEPHSYGALFFNAFATAGFLPSAGGKIPRRKAGVRAALLLAQLNDGRCVPPLIRVFETEGVWQNKYQEQIVTALKNYLSQAAKAGKAKDHVDEIAGLAARIWNHAPGKDVEAPVARLLLAAIRYLQAAGSNAGILRTIAQSDTSRPLRKEVRNTMNTV